MGRQQAEIFRAAGRGPAAAITGFLGRLEGAATRVGPRRRLFGILSPAGERGYDRVHKCPFTTRYSQFLSFSVFSLVASYCVLAGGGLVGLGESHGQSVWRTLVGNPRCPKRKLQPPAAVASRYEGRESAGRVARVAFGLWISVLRAEICAVRSARCTAGGGRLSLDVRAESVAWPGRCQPRRGSLSRVLTLVGLKGETWESRCPPLLRRGRAPCAESWS